MTQPERFPPAFRGMTSPNVQHYWLEVNAMQIYQALSDDLADEGVEAIRQTASGRFDGD